ncbi:hypothetical protein CXB51_004869 [Gossypium anomalum]|uniref:Uncharacterized protein n=1 Tax=Gossypium anomalum TaxID=47600 RepID=A0A8J5ZH47_9ROSI|nr:hypothetical protein CXB51_004869 [Gossypium anomalum]
MNTVILANRPLSLLSVLKSSFATFPINLPISPRFFFIVQITGKSWQSDPCHNHRREGLEWIKIQCPHLNHKILAEDNPRSLGKHSLIIFFPLKFYKKIPILHIHKLKRF